MPSSTSLVPPRRLGGLLRETRLGAGLELEDLTGRCGLTVVELGDIEHGRAPLTEELLARVAGAYGVQGMDLVPARAQLVIDLDEGLLAADRSEVALPGDAPDAVLARYLALVPYIRGYYE